MDRHAAVCYTKLTHRWSSFMWDRSQLRAVPSSLALYSCWSYAVKPTDAHHIISLSALVTFKVFQRSFGQADAGLIGRHFQSPTLLKQVCWFRLLLAGWLGVLCSGRSRGHRRGRRIRIWQLAGKLASHSCAVALQQSNLLQYAMMFFNKANVPI